MNGLARLIAGIAITLFACGLAMAKPLTLAIAKAAVVSDQAPGQRALNLKMTPDSAKAFADFTTANVGKVIDLSVDGAVVASPRLVEPILGGEVMLSGTFAPGELQRLAERISAGGAKVTVEVKAEQPL
ncbi:SecDF P1 head subdomain-containing protein [Mesorhizobium sp. 43Arga]